MDNDETSSAMKARTERAKIFSAVILHTLEHYIAHEGHSDQCLGKHLSRGGLIHLSHFLEYSPGIMDELDPVFRANFRVCLLRDDALIRLWEITPKTIIEDVIVLYKAGECATTLNGALAHCFSEYVAARVEGVRKRHKTPSEAIPEQMAVVVDEVDKAVAASEVNDFKWGILPLAKGAPCPVCMGIVEDVNEHEGRHTTKEYRDVMVATVDKRHQN